MLKLRNIVKDYVTDDIITHALKGVTVNFRKQEFVSILGQSGCGKTTLLNIIGGLDRYTKGDLLINGKSTKEYKDRDWDTYRNHSIGFVFQTYNLISHQNILKNVELALTISGVSKEERRQRAYEALRVVGLKGMEKKKPNQLSGGQCQRVAIARALINNPEILLADEPTGALDSETSIQIMDLLKEVATDRLVIMVTHNPDLAKAYSTRIIRMSDGLLTSDSNPFADEDAKIMQKQENLQEKQANSKKNPEEKRDISKGKKKKTSMSILTSMGLSTSNLLSKLRRTILVTIAGSIGIIGVSAVLGVSRGVKDYIGDMQNDMLSSYPLSIAEESVDLTSLLSGLSNREVREKFQFDPENPKVGINSLIEYLMTAYGDFTHVKTNTIDEDLMSFIYAMPKDAAAVITENYGIDPTNNIFGEWKADKDAAPRNYSLNGLTQSYIQELKTVQGFDEYATFVNLFTNFMKEMPDSKEYILDQYDVIAGEEPSLGENDLVFVVDQDTTLTDVILAEMGVINHDEFINIATRAINVQKIRENDELSEEKKNEEIDRIIEDTYFKSEFEYDELLSKKYKYYPQNSIYKNGTVTTDRIVASLICTSPLSMLELEFDHLQDKYSASYRDVAKPDTLYKPIKFDFTRVGDKPESNDPLVIAEGNWSATYLNADDTTTTYTMTVGATNPVVLTIDGTPRTFFSSDFLENPRPVKYEEFEGYSYNAEYQSSYGEGTEMQVKSILRLKDSKRFGCLSSGIYYSKAFGEKFMKDSVAYENSDTHEKNVTKALQEYIGSDLEKNAAFNAYVQFDFIDHRKKDSDGNPMTFTTCASSLNGDMSTSFSDLFSTITGTNNTSVDITHLRSISGLKTTLGYNEETGEVDTSKTIFEKIPQSISIYPKSFNDKDVITDYLDKWNKDGDLVVNVNGVDKVLEKESRPVLNYTDTISLIVSVIDTFINAITIALVVFTSLSLVVSCFMIAVITYISVVERIKEIGVIRSLGGRKRDVANLFIMETLLTGLSSGIFGIAFTYLLQLIVNIILKAQFGLAIMNLTIPTALIMIGISVALSVLSGLVPSQSAAHKDPVVALRSNE